MIRKFTEEEYLLSRSSDYLMFECEMCSKDFKKQKKFLKTYLKQKSNNHRARVGSIKYCSKQCEYEKRKEFFIKKECSFCGCDIFTKNHLIRKSKSGNMFCSKSCSATYNNNNKKHGNRRSKLEIWIESKLKEKYSIEIIFNGKEEINSELDIYIPSIKLAFELNGIFHYEPIYGIEKLKNIQNNENRKFQACLERNIELCIIDVSGSKNFKPERDIKYLEIIENIIDTKLFPSNTLVSSSRSQREKVGSSPTGNTNNIKF